MAGVVSGSPGEIVDITSQGFVVTATDGAIVIKRVQPEGSPKIGAAEFVEQVGLRVGDKLGD